MKTLILNSFILFILFLTLSSANAFEPGPIFPNKNGVYPRIELSNLVIEKVSKSKISFQFKLTNKTKNSIRLEDIDLIISIAAPIQNPNPNPNPNSNELLTQSVQFFDLLSAPLSDENFSISGNPLIVGPRKSFTVKVVLPNNLDQITLSTMEYLRVTVIENPNPQALPNDYIRKDLMSYRM